MSGFGHVATWTSGFAAQSSRDLVELIVDKLVN
jgi:hypothetical protein